MPLPDTRLSLLHRLHDQQDVSAWSEFCAIYERAIYRIAAKYGLQDADAREVAQEVLLTVSRRIHKFDFAADGKFRSWLATVARNATIDLLRKNRLATSGDSAIQRRLRQTVSPEWDSVFDVETCREQFRWAAEQVRASVNVATWQAFWRTAVEGHPVQDVAIDLEISVGAVYVARCRTLAKIKGLVETFREDAR